jgi:hypothetical protein
VRHVRQETGQLCGSVLGGLVPEGHDDGEAAPPRGSGGHFWA